MANESAFALAPSDRTIPNREFSRIIYLAQRVYEFAGQGLTQEELPEVAGRLSGDINVLKGCIIEIRDRGFFIKIPLEFKGERLDLVFGEVSEKDKTGEILFGEDVNGLDIYILKEKLRAHRFRKDVRDILEEDLRQAKDKLGISDIDIERIINKGVVRRDGGKTIFENDVILEFAVFAVNKVLAVRSGRKIKIDDLKKALNYHEELHKVMTPDRVNDLRADLIQSLTEDEYILLFRNFENQYGHYTNEEAELEIIEELFCNFYMERLIGEFAGKENELWLIDDAGNRVNLDKETIKIMEDAGKNIERMTEDIIWRALYTDWTPIDNAIPDRIQSGRGRGTKWDGEDDSVTILFRDMGSYKPYNEFTAPQEKVIYEELEKGNKSAFDTLVNSNLRLVISIAKKYKNQGLPFSDLIQEGILGLMKAIRRFDYKKGFRLSTYATWWIKQVITRAIMDTGKTVRHPVHFLDEVRKITNIANELGIDIKMVSINDEEVIKRLAYAYAREKAINRLKRQGNKNPTEEEIEVNTKVDLKAVRRMVSNVSKLIEPVSLDEEIGEKGEGYTLHGEVPSRMTKDEMDRNELRESVYKLLHILFAIFAYMLENEDDLGHKVMLYRDMNIYLLSSGILPNTIKEDLITIAQIRELEEETGFKLHRKALAVINTDKAVPASLENIAFVYGLTRERIRQIGDKWGFVYEGIPIDKIVSVIMRGEEGYSFLRAENLPKVEKTGSEIVITRYGASIRAINNIVSIIDIAPAECLKWCDKDLINNDSIADLKSVILKTIELILKSLADVIEQETVLDKNAIKQRCDIYLMKIDLISFAIVRGILSFDELESLQEKTGFRIDERFLNAIGVKREGNGKKIPEANFSDEEIADIYGISEEKIQKFSEGIGKRLRAGGMTVCEVIIRELIKATIFGNLGIRTENIRHRKPAEKEDSAGIRRKRFAKAGIELKKKRKKVQRHKENESKSQKTRDFLRQNSDIKDGLIKRGTLYRLIIEYRILRYDKTLKEIANSPELPKPVSRERVRQAEAEIFRIVNGYAETERPDGKAFPAGLYGSEMPDFDKVKWTGDGIKLSKKAIKYLLDRHKGKLSIDDSSFDLFSAENASSANLEKLFTACFIYFSAKISGDRILSDLFYDDVLGLRQNRHTDVYFRIAENLPVNSHRYYDKKKKRVVIAIDKRFIDVLLNNMDSVDLMPAVYWILAERVFIHELSHNNVKGSQEEEVEEECAIIRDRDFVFYRDMGFKDAEISGSIKAFRKIKGVRDVLMSDDYFSILKGFIDYQIRCKTSDEFMLFKKIMNREIKRFVRGIFMRRKEQVEQKEKVVSEVFGTSEDRDNRLTLYKDILKDVTEKGEMLKKLKDNELKERVVKLKDILAKNGEIDTVLVESLAIFREAAERALNIRPYDEQVLGAIGLIRGQAVQMLTGEGKTISIAMAAFAISLFGKGVHVVTFNDYLAKRDISLMGMGKVYEFMGISVALRDTRDRSYLYKSGSKSFIGTDFNRVTEPEAYSADVTYGSSDIFVFDYEHDNLALSPAHKIQRPLFCAIIDEGDSILLDEAFNPLSISKTLKHYFDQGLYYKIAELAEFLEKGKHYYVDEKNKSVVPFFEEIIKEEKYVSLKNEYEKVPNVIFENCIIQALTAKEILHTDEDYIIEGSRIVIIDGFTGRPKYGYTWGSGLHQAVEAKEREKVKYITYPSRTFSLMCKYLYYNGYAYLSCCSGTLADIELYLKEMYGLKTIEIPSRLPVLMEVYPSLLFKTEKEKLEAVLAEAREMREKGRPVLIGTRTIKQSEVLSDMFSRAKIPHNVLNGKKIAEEADIIANAGQSINGKGNVTIVTNMAGRGTDIIINQDAENYGGFHVISAEYHETKRIENQLKGRGARQGAKGSFRAYFSLEDYLLRRYGMAIDKDGILKDTAKRIEKALRNNISVRSRLWGNYQYFHEKFLNARCLLFSKKDLYRDDITEFIEGLRIAEDEAQFPDIAIVLLKKLIDIEKAGLDQVTDRKKLVRSRRGNAKANILEIVDLDYERFIFRMQALEELITRSAGENGADTAVLYKIIGMKIYREFIEETDADLKGSNLYARMTEKRKEYKKNKDIKINIIKLDKIKAFLENHPEIRVRLEENEKWAVVIKERVFNGEKSRPDVVKLNIGISTSRGIGEIENRLLEIAESYEGGYEERKELYLSNFTNGRYMYLFPEEEKKALKELIEIVGHSGYSILAYLRKKNKNLGIRTVYERCRRAGIIFLVGGPRVDGKVVDSPIFVKLEKVRKFLAEHPDIKSRLEEIPLWKEVITHRIIDQDMSQRELAAKINCSRYDAVGKAEKIIIKIIDSYGGDFDKRKKKYIADFAGGEFGYLFPDEERQLLKEIAEANDYKLKAVLRYLKIINRASKREIVRKRFVRIGIELREEENVRLAESQAERIEKIKEFLAQHPELISKFCKYKGIKYVIDHIMGQQIEKERYSGTRLAVSVRHLYEVVKSYDGLLLDRKEKYLSEFSKGKLRFLFPDEEGELLREVAKLCGYNVEKILFYLRIGGKNRGLEHKEVRKRFGDAGVELNNEKYEVKLPVIAQRVQTAKALKGNQDAKIEIPKDQGTNTNVDSAKIKTDTKPKVITDRLEKVRNFLVKFSEMKTRLEEKDNWKFVIEHRIMQKDMTLAETASRLGLKGISSIGHIEDRLIEIVDSFGIIESSFDDTYEERKRKYLLNFGTAEFKYLLPDEEKETLRLIAEEHSNGIKSVVKYLREYSKNKSLQIFSVVNRFKRAGIELQLEEKIKAYSTKRRSKNLEKVKALLERFPDLRKRLEDIHGWSLVIKHRIVQKDMEKKELAKLIGFKTGNWVDKIEKKLISIANSFRNAAGPFDETYPLRREQYLLNFKKADYGYLFPDEERVLLNAIAERFNYDKEAVLKYLRRVYKNWDLGEMVMIKRFARAGIELKAKKDDSKEKFLDGLPVPIKPRKMIKVIDASCLFYWDEKENSLKLKARGFNKAIRDLGRSSKRKNIQIEEHIEFLIINVDRQIGRAGIIRMRDLLHISYNEKLVYFKDFTDGGEIGINQRIDLLSEINKFREREALGSDLSIAYSSTKIHGDIFGNTEGARSIKIEQFDESKEEISAYGLVWALILEDPELFRNLPNEIKDELKKEGITEAEGILNVKPVPLLRELEEEAKDAAGESA